MSFVQNFPFFSIIKRKKSQEPDAYDDRGYHGIVRGDADVLP